MTATTTRTPEDTRQKILMAAFEEFYRNGFQGGSLNHIVEKAKTTKGALFHHFEGKSDLGHAVIDEIIQPIAKMRWWDPLADSIDPVADVKRSFRQAMKEDIEGGHVALGCPLNNLAQEMSPLDKGFRERIEKLYVTWRDVLTSAFARGIKAGKVKKEVSPRQVAAFIVASQMGIWGSAKNSQSAEMMEQATEALCGYLDSLKP